MAATLQFHTTTSNLGGAVTGTQLSGTPMNNLFDNVTPAEALSGDVEYRAFDVKNTGDATATVVNFYATETTSTSTTLHFAIESTPANAVNSTKSIADESTSPTGLGAWTQYTSASKLSLPDIAAAATLRVWVRRTVTAAAPNLANDQTTFTVEYA
jgi:hypothetical protein